jgi:uncharacterized protein YqhQ
MLKKMYCFSYYLLLLILIGLIIYTILDLFDIVKDNNLIIPIIVLGILYNKFESKCKSNNE